VETPKPLLAVANRPFLHHQLELLKSHGAHRVVICVGYLGERIEASIGRGDGFGLDIRYAHDGPALAGTAGAVRNALPLLGERFLVLYGDTYLRIDYREVAAELHRRGLPAIMTVLRNEGRWDTSNAEVDGGMVRHYDKRAPTPAMGWIDYGLAALTPAAFDAAPGASDLADVYAALALAGRLGAFEARERFYEIGTPEALRETEAFLLKGAERT
jgi:NDP-sugar pyrophosphorylase family protein